MIGLIVAMQSEADAIAAHYASLQKTEYRSLTFYEGKIDGAHVVMTRCGEGKVNAAYAATVMAEHYAPKVMISTGIAGGLGRLSMLNVLVADSVVQHDVDVSALGHSKGCISGAGCGYWQCDADVTAILRSAIPDAVTGRLATGDQFVADSHRAAEIVEDFRAVACDMEGGAVAQIAARYGIRYGAIKVISDSATDGAAISFAELTQRASQINSDAIVAGMKAFNKLK